MSCDAQRPRLDGVTLTSVVLAAAAVYGAIRADLVKSFEARASDWHDYLAWRRGDGLIGPCFSAPPDYVGCFGRPDQEACYRELYRAQVEAYETNQSYDEVRAVSPTGVAFVAPTRVYRRVRR
jgi:hypothetical protein